MSVRSVAGSGRAPPLNVVACGSDAGTLLRKAPMLAIMEALIATSPRLKPGIPQRDAVLEPRAQATAAALMLKPKLSGVAPEAKPLSSLFM